jgi:hypothetical protein
MGIKNFSERRVILFTASLILLSGLLRQFSYTAGIVLFYISFAPFLAYRLSNIIKKKWSILNSVEKYRFVILLIMIVSLTFNLLGWQEAAFFLLFHIMIDFLLVNNKKF